MGWACNTSKQLEKIQFSKLDKIPLNILVMHGETNIKGKMMQHKFSCYL